MFLSEDSHSIALLFYPGQQYFYRLALISTFYLKYLPLDLLKGFYPKQF
jgi:hypothetical protein